MRSPQDEEYHNNGVCVSAESVTIACKHGVYVQMDLNNIESITVHVHISSS